MRKIAFIYFPHNDRVNPEGVHSRDPTREIFSTIKFLNYELCIPKVVVPVYDVEVDVDVVVIQ